MARILHVISIGGGGNSLSQVSGTLLLLCMIVASISIISMVILACGREAHYPDKHHKRCSRGWLGVAVEADVVVVVEADEVVVKYHINGYLARYSICTC
ncbi:hypothetical protein IFM89_032286 [Coptis chinensis]|uniref:Uncharacterized protein n=1 Tax=Coptis chinensis TaxID=261450 RepID=A0A835H408_9MAGN|nr:hypothetical protein IFM89_032286 [Coptis chinensis]